MVGRLKRILRSVGQVRLKNYLVLKVRFIFSFFCIQDIKLIQIVGVSNSQSGAFLKTSAEEFISTFLGNVLL